MAQFWRLFAATLVSTAELLHPVLFCRHLLSIDVEHVADTTTQIRAFTCWQLAAHHKQACDPP